MGFFPNFEVYYLEENEALESPGVQDLQVTEFLESACLLPDVTVFVEGKIAYWILCWWFEGLLHDTLLHFEFVCMEIVTEAAGVYVFFSILQHWKLKISIMIFAWAL